MNKEAFLTTIHLKDLGVSVIIGTRPEERIQAQKVMLNISFDYDARLAAETDALGHAVDYAAIHDRIIKKVSKTQFFLLERLAGFILDLIMEDDRIMASKVEIDKPDILKIQSRYLLKCQQAVLNVP